MSCPDPPISRVSERKARRESRFGVTVMTIAGSLAFGRLISVLTGLTMALMSAAPSSATEADMVPMAVSARIIEAEAGSRLTIDLSAMVSAKAFVLEKPDRVIVDLPEINFQIPPETGHPAGKAGGLIKSFRFGLIAPGKSRIVIDLTAPAAVRRTSVEPIAGGAPSRLVIELGRTDRTSFHAAVHPEPPPIIDAGITPPSGAGPQPVVVIDPGHGGIDPGASGVDGVTEKRIVFDFASVLAAKLAVGGRYKIVMTRTNDAFVTLGDRVKIARQAGAALFVSIHADTLGDPGVTGATVYTASDRASDAEAAHVAASENRADEIAGLETAPDTPGVSDILFDLTRRETRTYAHLYQRTLVGYWQKIARLNKNPERSAGFKVLQAPDVPSVLLELGYLSSSQDCKTLTSTEWRDRATDGVARSIDAFFAQRRTLDAGPDTIADQPGVPELVANRPHP